MTSFVGREKEVAEITALIDANPLVTLVGSGGVGKTRTSLQVAANLIDGSGDGVWFIELAPLTSGEYVPTTIAQPSAHASRRGRSARASRPRARAKRALLVFDNCEHLVDASTAISRALRGARTSRFWHRVGKRSASRVKKRIACPRSVSRYRRRTVANGDRGTHGAGDRTLHRARAGRRQSLHAHRRERADRRGHLPKARRHSARDRTRGGA
jgi:hypothetical protein